MVKKVTTDLDTVINPDNVKVLGETIALCALKHFLPYRKVENYYFGLIRDIHCQHDITRPLSDGYDFAQTAICFLCEHMGKTLGDTIMGKYKRPVTIRHACYSEVGNMVYRRCQDQIHTRVILKTDRAKTEQPFEEDTAEQSYDRVEEIISAMKLTKKQMQTLEYYLQGLGVCEIARILSINNTTVWRSRMILQRKYKKYLADVK